MKQTKMKRAVDNWAIKYAKGEISLEELEYITKALKAQKSSTQVTRWIIDEVRRIL